MIAKIGHVAKFGFDRALEDAAAFVAGHAHIQPERHVAVGRFAGPGLAFVIAGAILAELA